MEKPEKKSIKEAGGDDSKWKNPKRSQSKKPEEMVQNRKNRKEVNQRSRRRWLKIEKPEKKSTKEAGEDDSKWKNPKISQPKKPEEMTQNRKTRKEVNQRSRRR